MISMLMRSSRSSSLAGRVISFLLVRMKARISKVCHQALCHSIVYNRHQARDRDRAFGAARRFAFAQKAGLSGQGGLKPSCFSLVWPNICGDKYGLARNL